MGVNKFWVTGRLTAKPEVKSFGQGGKVAKLSVAVDNRKKDQATGQWVTEPMTIDFETFDSQERKNATGCEKLEAGQSISLEGRFKVEHWTDKRTNQTRQSVKHVVEEIQLAGFTAPQVAIPSQPKQQQAPAPVAEDVPF